MGRPSCYSSMNGVEPKVSMRVLKCSRAPASMVSDLCQDIMGSALEKRAEDGGQGS